MVFLPRTLAVTKYRLIYKHTRMKKTDFKAGYESPVLEEYRLPLSLALCTSVTLNQLTSDDDDDSFFI